MNDRVECYSGASYAERPVALIWEGQKLEVNEILSEKRTPEGKTFRVCVNDNRQFDLLYDEKNDNWQVILVG